MELSGNVTTETGLLDITPGKLPEQFGGVAWLDVTYSVAGGDLFGGSTWLNQI